MGRGRAPLRKVFSKIRARNAYVTLELRGSDDDALREPTQAWVVSPNGHRRFVASPETYIVAGQISGDARFALKGGGVHRVTPKVFARISCSGRPWIK